MKRNEDNKLYHRNIARKQVIIEKIKVLAWHFLALFSWLIASIVFLRDIPIILIMGSLIWTLSALVAHLRKNEREKIIKRTYQTIFAYTWGLVGYLFILKIWQGIPAEAWARTLMVDAPEATMISFSGWIRMVFRIYIFGTPVGYFGYLFSKFFTFTTRKEVHKRRKEMMRED